MALPVFRAAGTKGAGTTAATSIPLPAGLQANDICILVATTIAGATISITTSGSITWNAIDNQDVTAGERVYAWWGRYASGTTAPTLTASSDHICGGIAAWSGCDSAGTPLEIVAKSSETTSDTSFSWAPGTSTTRPNSMCIVICSSGVDSNTAQFSGAFTNANLANIATRLNFNTSSGLGGGFGLAQGALATAGAVGTWAETLAGASPKAYISFALVSAVGLTLNENLHTHLSDNVDATQVHILTTNDNLHSHISETPSITQVHLLAIDANIHSTISDGSIAVTQEVPSIALFPNDNVHAHISENVAITQIHIVVINDNIHSHLSDTPAITQVHIVIVSDNVHAHVSDSATITVDPINLTVNSNVHSHVSENVTITVDPINLTANSNVHLHLSDTTSITQIHLLVVEDNVHSQSFDATSVTQIHVLSINDNVHSHLSDGNIIVSGGSIDLYPNSNIHTHISESTQITQVHVLSINNNIHGLISDGNVVTTQTYNLSVNSNIHAHTSENVNITQVHILSVDANIHSEESDNVIVERNDKDLYPNDNVHSHTSETIIIMQTISQRKLEILGFVREPALDGDGNIVYTLVDTRPDRHDGVRNKYKLTIWNDGIYKFESFMYRLPEFFVTSDIYYGVIPTNKEFVKLYSQFKGHNYRMAEYPFPPQYYDDWL